MGRAWNEWRERAFKRVVRWLTRLQAFIERQDARIEDDVQWMRELAHSLWARYANYRGIPGTTSRHWIRGPDGTVAYVEVTHGDLRDPRQRVPIDNAFGGSDESEDDD